MDAVVVRKRLEQDITELEITLEGVNKARAEAEKSLKQYQQEIGDLETLLEQEQQSKFDVSVHLLYTVSQKNWATFFTTCNFRNIEQIFTKFGTNQSLFILNIVPEFI